MLSVEGDEDEPAADVEYEVELAVSDVPVASLRMPEGECLPWEPGVEDDPKRLLSSEFAFWKILSSPELSSPEDDPVGPGMSLRTPLPRSESSDCAPLGSFKTPGPMSSLSLAFGEPVSWGRAARLLGAAVVVTFEASLYWTPIMFQ